MGGGMFGSSEGSRTLAAGVLLLVGSLLACGSGNEKGKAGDGSAAGAIPIGHVASLTGDTATFGQSTDRGMRMAI